MVDAVVELGVVLGGAWDEDEGDVDEDEVVEVLGVVEVVEVVEVVGVVEVFGVVEVVGVVKDDTGHVVVDTGTTTVVRTVDSAGQLTTVGAQLMMVLVLLE